MLRNRDFEFTLGAALLLVMAPVGLVRAQAARDTVTITSVLAVEQARSDYGLYRVIFETAAPLPSATNSHGAPRFFLGPEPLRIPPGNDSGTRIFAYCDRVPPKATKLRAESPDGGRHGRGAIISEQACDPADLLRNSRPAPGQYEAAYIQRTARPVDLLRAWTESDVTALATFTRFDVAPGDMNSQQREFRIDEVLRGDTLQSGATVGLHPGAGFEYELSVQYLLFLHRDSQNDVDPEHYVAVRIWWSSADPVLTWLRAVTPKLDELNAAAAEATTVFAGALRSAAAPVRFTAATRLASLVASGVKLSAAQRSSIAARLSSEPDAAIRAALRVVVPPASRPESG